MTAQEHMYATSQPMSGQLQSRPFVPASRVQGFGATVFAEYTAMAIEHGAVNLGQGFPNFAAPDFIKQAAQEAIAADLNQYTRYAGHPRLVEALGQVYGKPFGRAIDPMTEIVVTVGATEGIFATLQALIEPGDEVILFEPFYDSYPAATVMAGGKPVYVPLRPPNSGSSSYASEWTFDPGELAAAFSDRTRLIIVNNPQNALGKVYTRSELETIADLVQAHDAYVLADEVYEWMTYPDAEHESRRAPIEHIRIATLPGMWDRTVTLGSAGKTFSVTGWKIGWAITAKPIAHAILMGHQWIPFTVATPLQEAVAVGLERVEAEGYFAWLGQMYAKKRDKLMTVLHDVGIAPVKPDGSYFILADSSRLNVPHEAGVRRDVSACRWLTKVIGVAAIPPSHFYSPANQSLTDNLVRFCFCKTDDMLNEAAQRLYAKFR